MTNNTYCSKEINALMGLIDTYKKWENFQSRNNRRYKYYHPSEFGKCLRLQQYKHYTELGWIKVEPIEIDSRSLRLFDKGHNMHFRWINYFNNIGKIIRGRWRCTNPICYLFNDSGHLKSTFGKYSRDEFISKIYQDGKTRVYGKDGKQGIFRPESCACGCRNFTYLETVVEDKELKLKGNSDVIIDCSNLKKDLFKEVRSTFDIKFLPTNGEKVVGDFKTINQSSWNFQLEKKGPHKSYIIQLIIYIHILDCKYGVLMYENKNNSEIKWYKINRNDEWWNIIKWQSYAMQDMVKDKKLPPPRPISKTSYDCKRCDFKNLCHKSKIWQDHELEEKRRNFYKNLL